MFHVLASDLPKYMKDVLGFSVREVGLFSSLPYLPMWIVSILSGFLCDYLINRQYISVLNARKIFTTLCRCYNLTLANYSSITNIDTTSFLAAIFPALFVVAASYAGCDKLLVVLSFLLAMTFMGNYYPGMRVNVLDLSPNYAGTVISISNGVGSLSGVVVPTFIGIMTPNVIQTLFHIWKTIYWALFLMIFSRLLSNGDSFSGWHLLLQRLER